MRRLIIGLVAGAILATATVAVASIPDPTGVIHGCRSNKDGSLRVIDNGAGQTCKSAETALNWWQDPLAQLITVTSGATLSFDAGGTNGTAAACPSGWPVATGGGAEAPTSSPLVLTSTMPLDSSNRPIGWQAIWRNTSTSALADVTVTIHIVCGRSGV